MSDPRAFEVLPFVGFGPIRFGMTRVRVEQILGEPSAQREGEDSNGNMEVEWEYRQLAISLCFSSVDQYRLGTISSEGNHTALFGGYPLLQSVAVLERLFLAQDGITLRPEDEYPDLDAKDYSCDELGLLFFVEAGKTVRLSMFPAYIGDIPIWPEMPDDVVD